MTKHTQDSGKPNRRPRDTRQQRGWYWYDWANSSFPTTVLTVFFGPYLIEVARVGADVNGQVSVFGWMLQPEQLFFYAIPASALIQILTLPILGAFVDRSAHKRRWLATTAYLGALLTIGMFFIVPGAWRTAVVLVILANIAFQASIVVYDSFLPTISKADDRDRISSRGWALGYIGGGLLLALNLAIYLFEPAGISGALAARVSLASAGVWWAVFTIIPLTMLEDGPAIQIESGNRTVVRGAFSELIRTTRGLADYPETVRFLVAFLLFNGGVSTTIVAAGSYAISELELNEQVLITAILMVQFVAFFGALIMGRIAERVGAKTVVLWSLVLWSAVVTYGRFIPAGEVVVFFVLAGAIGFVLGGTQALSRSLFSHLIPAQREAEFYSFYQISDRGTNILGPAALAWAYGVFGSYRLGILVLIGFFVAGGLMLVLTDMRRGIDAVGNEQPRVL